MVALLSPSDDRIGGTPSVRSVMFLGGGFARLTEDNPYRKAEQLAAVIQLLDFANAYVLNDCTIIAGNTWGGRYGSDDFLSEFINNEIIHADSIELLGSPLIEKSSARIHDVQPYFEAAGTDGLSKHVKELQSKSDRLLSQLSTVSEFEYENTKRKYWDAMDRTTAAEDESRVRQMQSYMLFADRTGAESVPEYLYGIEALRTYPTFIDKIGCTISRRPFHEHFQKLSEELIRRLKEPVELSNIEFLRQPCFLVEALRTVESGQGLGHALRELRQSAAAMSYRELNRKRLYSSSISEKGEAENELQRAVSQYFGKEGFESRVPAVVKVIAALSTLGVGHFFPALAYVGGLVTAGLGGVEIASAYIRKRRCPFLGLFNDNSGTLFTELHAKFPNIAFEPADLAAKLAERKNALRPLLSA
jgi:hypothetical protein